MIDRFPAFEPHRLLRSGHLQTVAAAMFQGKQYPDLAQLHPVILDNGDTAYLHDDCPPDWKPNQPVALLVHGLGGCARSTYMTRIAGRLNESGVRTFRMDFRACGAGEGQSRLPYHAGCAHDVLDALRQVTKICPGVPLSLIGFSIGGNVTLKLLGEYHNQLPAELIRATVVSPPIDLNKCVDRLALGPARYYDRYLTRLLYQQLRRSDQLVDHAPHIVEAARPLNQRAFDELYTARVWGFDTAEQLYTATSSLPYIRDIRIPTLLFSSRDDPLVPAELFEQLKAPNSLGIHLTDHGGHLGFIGRGRTDLDRRWMDWRIVDWVTANFATGRQRLAA